MEGDELPLSIEALEERARAMGFLGIGDMFAAHEEAHQAITTPGTGAAALTEDEVAAGVAYDDRHVLVPVDVYRAMIQQTHDAGRQAYEAEIAPRIEALGFRDVGGLLQAIEGGNNTPQEPPVTTPGNNGTIPPRTAAPAQTPAAGAGRAPGDDPVNDRRIPEQLRRRLASFRDQARDEAAKATAARIAAEEQLAAKDAALAAQQKETEHKIALVRAGVQDVDYAWYQMQAHLKKLKESGKPEDQEALSKFDPKVWATELRKTTPYVFGEQVVPASSPGPAGGAPTPTVPSAATVQTGVAAAGQFDARRASPTEFRNRMNELGVPYTGQAPPMVK